MSRQFIMFAACVIVLSLCSEAALARGGRGGGGGGGRGGGGGGARMGGGGGGGARPSGGYGGGARPGGGYGGAVNRTPSMSRAPHASPAARPAARPSAPSYGGGRSPAAGMGQRGPAGGAVGQRGPVGPAAGQRGPAAGNMMAGPGAGQSAFRTQASYNRPTQGQVGNFLGMSSGAAAGAAVGSNVGNRAAAGGNLGARADAGAGANIGARNAGSPPAASQLPSNSGTRTFTTERGGTITVGGAGGSAQVGGGTVGAGVGGIKVETAGGATAGKVGGAVGVSGSSGAAVRTGSVSGAQGARGSIANVSRGYADTAGNVARGSATVAQNRAGYTAANVRGGYASGGVGQIGSVSGVRGPGGNVVAAGRGASFVNGQFVGGRSWGAVNGAYTRWNAFTPGWYGRYPGAWFPGRWAIAATAWYAASWPYASGYYGYGGEPVYYDYGNNVAYDQGQVYVDDQPVATAEEYYNQANQIAATGAQPANDEWLPIGVFAIIAEEGQTQTDKIVQLAINRDGVVRGNYQDMLTDQVTPVTGAIDKATQRVSLKLEGNDQLVVETGIYNLTNDEAPVLVHFGPDRQEGRLFIRLKKPEYSTEAQATAPTPVPAAK